MTKPEKPKPPDDAAQSARFLATVKDLEIEDDPTAFEAAIEAITPPKEPPKTPASKQTKR